MRGPSDATTSGEMGNDLRGNGQRSPGQRSSITCLPDSIIATSAVSGALLTILVAPSVPDEREKTLSQGVEKTPPPFPT